MQSKVVTEMGLADVNPRLLSNTTCLIGCVAHWALFPCDVTQFIKLSPLDLLPQPNIQPSISPDPRPQLGLIAGGCTCSLCPGPPYFLLPWTWEVKSSSLHGQTPDQYLGRGLELAKEAQPSL